MSAVAWTASPTNITVNGTLVTKTGGTNGVADAFVSSADTLTGPGYVSWAVDVIGDHALGLTQPGQTTFATLDFTMANFGALWEIYENNVFRAQGALAADDTLKIVVTDTTVEYFHNDVSVRGPTAVTVTFPLLPHVVFWASGAAIRDAVQALDGGEPPPPPDSVGPGFSLRTDRVTAVRPALPTVGVAGSTFSDPSFLTVIRRVTDGNTDTPINKSYRTPSSVHCSAWAKDSSKFYLNKTDGTILVFDVNVITGVSTFREYLTFNIEPTFSQVSANLIYGKRTATPFKIDQYNFDTSTYTAILDLQSFDANLAGTVMGGTLVASALAPERVLVFYGGTSQDLHMKLVVFEKDTPANRHVVHTLNSTLDGVATNITLDFKIHAAAMDRSGRYVSIYPTAADVALGREGHYLYDVTAGTFTTITAFNGGHDAYGYGCRVNQSSAELAYDAFQFQLRYLATPNTRTNIIDPPMTPSMVYMADHPNWNNALDGTMVPFIEATYRYYENVPENLYPNTSNTVAWRAWDNEITAVHPSTGVVYRVAHHRSNIYSDDGVGAIGFWYTPRPQIDPSGTWALFTSNWEKTLGTDAGGTASEAYRQDTFLVRLSMTTIGNALQNARYGRLGVA